MARVTSLSQERATLKHRLTLLERQLRCTEDELSKVTTETENRPISDLTSNGKVRRKRIQIICSLFSKKQRCNKCNVFYIVLHILVFE